MLLSCILFGTVCILIHATTTMSSEEEWTVVTCHDKRRVIRSGRRNSLPRAIAPTSSKTWSDETRRAVMTTIAKCQRDLVYTNFYQSLIKSIFENQTVVDQIICYGIGSLSPKPTAPMWQLSCALNLREEVNDIPLLFYDPCTTTCEAKLMTEEFKIQVITENERGKRNVNGLTSLFFMPHCPLLLYANVLWANWEEKSRVILFGNSLPMYQERTMEKSKFPDTLFILLPFVKQTRVDVSKSDIEKTDGNLESAFNDSYLTRIMIDDDTELPNRPPQAFDGDGEVI